jgi:hypothetical protein
MDRTTEEARNHLAILESWGPIDAKYMVEVPIGTKLIAGAEAPQAKDMGNGVVEHRAGGGYQVWMNEVPKEWLRN